MLWKCVVITIYPPRHHHHIVTLLSSVRLRPLRGPLYRTTHPHHRQQLQQVLREGQDRGGDTCKEEENILGRG